MMTDSLRDIKVVALMVPVRAEFYSDGTCAGYSTPTPEQIHQAYEASKPSDTITSALDQLTKKINARAASLILPGGIADDELIRRATNAYLRHTPNADLPCSARSTVVRPRYALETVYVRLANVNGDLAQYTYYPTSNRLRRTKASNEQV